MAEKPDIPIQAASFNFEEMPVAVRPEDAPLIFCDGFQGLAVYNDVVRINAYQLSQNLENAEGPPSRVFVARLTMTPATLAQLMKWLSDTVQVQEVAGGEVARGATAE
ncbi:hypothetical protein OU426_16010 [Frigidibacter sp. RF13]|uniref:hypothetical protein n=1 Tax=Frigidibacter sp. RF13 TaxID=2997340 RepID=UPI002270DFD9|nr:hypothetical protein [Frigidibacter sp. RF13]MCY1128370.1 hypothetical protein [Frigidibacter sp. RF13]